MTPRRPRLTIVLLAVSVVAWGPSAALPQAGRLEPLPRFRLPGAMRRAESFLNRGLYGRGIKGLESFIKKTKDEAEKKTAVETLEAVKKHGERSLTRAEGLANDEYFAEAVGLALEIETVFKGTEIARKAAKRLKAWRRDKRAKSDLEAAELVQRAKKLAGKKQTRQARAVLGKLVKSKKYSGTRSRELAVEMLEALSGKGPYIPVTGRPRPELRAFDEAVLQFLRETRLQAGTLAVSRNGRLLHKRGFGWSDRDRKVETPPDTPMRIASISKPITSAIVNELIREGKLERTTRVYRLLGIKPPRRQEPDPGLLEVNVQHLLDHKGGWDPERSYDPMFADDRIRRALGLKRPPEQRQIIQYMWGEPLQFAPGVRHAYSNFGYCVLGRVIEKVTGEPFSRVLEKRISRPLGASTIQVGVTTPADRPPQEVWYPDDGRAGFRIEVLDSHGGVISSAADLCRFMAAYWIGGERRRQKTGGEYTFFGSLPSTTAMARQRGDGVDIAVLFNGRRVRFKKDNERLEALMDRAADSIKKWPGREAE